MLTQTWLGNCFPTFGYPGIQRPLQPGAQSPRCFSNWQQGFGCTACDAGFAGMKIASSEVKEASTQIPQKGLGAQEIYDKMRILVGSPWECNVSNYESE
jgi:hypothetical protein